MQSKEYKGLRAPHTHLFNRTISYRLTQPTTNANESLNRRENNCSNDTIKTKSSGYQLTMALKSNMTVSLDLSTFKKKEDCL